MDAYGRSDWFRMEYPLKGLEGWKAVLVKIAPETITESDVISSGRTGATSETTWATCHYYNEVDASQPRLARSTELPSNGSPRQRT